MQLEDLQANAAVRGILADALVTVVSVQWFGAEALELTYKTPGGALANELLYRHDEARLEIARLGRPWSFDGDGALFRLVSEARRIRLAHLMVNYDLPWNPNRLEQRFGRIHRIGQTEVCHLWNLVADETREGDVYRKLLDKLEQARHSLGGRVFDVLGRLHFEGRPLRDAVNPVCYPLGVRLCQANTLSRHG